MTTGNIILIILMILILVQPIYSSYIIIGLNKKYKTTKLKLYCKKKSNPTLNTVSENDELKFSVANEDVIKIENWKIKHKCKLIKHDANQSKQSLDFGPCGGNCQYQYVFTPTSLGDLLTVTCECGDSLYVGMME